MKIPVQLSKGLTTEQKKQLESELKNSLLVKQLRAVIQERLLQLEIAEEMIDAQIYQIYSIIGQRRGFRQVLNLIDPEEKSNG